MLEYCLLALGNKLQWNFNRNRCIFIKKLHLKMPSAKWRIFRLRLNELNHKSVKSVKHIHHICYSSTRADTGYTQWLKSSQEQSMHIKYYNANKNEDTLSTIRYANVHNIGMRFYVNYYRKTSSINRTKSRNLNVSCILLQLSSLNSLKLGVKLRMKM